jgi:hypothetical protein
MGNAFEPTNFNMREYEKKNQNLLPVILIDGAINHECPGADNNLTG